MSNGNHAPRRPFRICVALAHFHPVSGGVENQMLALCERWADAGHDPIVLTRVRRGAPPREIVRGVDIRRVIRPVSLGPLFGATYILSLNRALKRLADQYDVVVTGQVPWEAVASGMTCPALSKPSAVCIQQTGPFGDLTQINKARGADWLKQRVLQNSAFIPLSAQGRVEALAFGCAPSSIFPLTSGVDCGRFSPGAPGVPIDRHQTVLFVGRFVPQKNPQMLLEAWRMVNREGKYRLWLAGAGPLELELRQFCERHSLRNVEFLGYRSDMIDVYRQAGVFCLPSRGEGCPNALLEAIACGACPVVTNVGGNNDVVTDRKNGRTVPNEDAGSLAAALQEVLESRDTQRRYAEAARAHVLAHHEIDKVARRYLEVFERLLMARAAANSPQPAG